MCLVPLYDIEYEMSDEEGAGRMEELHLNRESDQTPFLSPRRPLPLYEERPHDYPRYSVPHPVQHEERSREYPRYSVPPLVHGTEATPDAMTIMARLLERLTTNSEADRATTQDKFDTLLNRPTCSSSSV